MLNFLVLWYSGHLQPTNKTTKHLGTGRSGLYAPKTKLKSKK